MTDTYLNKLIAIDLPIVGQLKAICETMQQTPNLVLQAEPGAGKTTLVPIALLDVIPVDNKILVLEPRRLAARNAAARMAELLKEPIGQTVGYRIKNDTCVTGTTRIEVVTEGILTRMIQTDPELMGVGLIIFDEFHERSLDAEIGLAFSLEVQRSIREDLKILVMSATLNTAPLSKLLGNSPIIECQGRSFPVSIEYRPAKANSYWLEHLVSIIREAMSDDYIPIEQLGQSTDAASSGDILVFLPGVAEINKVALKLDALTQSQGSRRWQVMSLYGALPFEQQRKVLLPIKGVRRIILSTNIAETSVTINGVMTVIDSGLMRQSRFDANVGFNRLFTRKISSASATQRAGRAGRLAPGRCFRAWSESETLRAETEAEIQREDLSRFSLEVAKWGIKNTEELALLEAPNIGNLSQARSLLLSLKAMLPCGKITEHGLKLCELGVHPRIAHMLIQSKHKNASALASVIAAMLEEKDIFEGDARFSPDFRARLDFLLNRPKASRLGRQVFEQAVKLNIAIDKLSLGGLAEKAATQVTENTQTSTKSSSQRIKPVTTEKPFNHSYSSLLKAAIEQYRVTNNQAHCINAASVVATAFPDRIAQKRGAGYRLSNGSGVTANEDIHFDDEFLVIIKAGGTAAKSKIHQAIALSMSELEAIYGNQFVIKESVKWQPKTQKVEAYQLTLFGELEIAKKRIEKPTESLVLNGLIEGVRQLGLDCLPWNEGVRQWQKRVELLRKTCSDQEQIPDLSDPFLLASLEEWLLPFIGGMNKLSQITPKLLKRALESQIEWNLQQRLDHLMPQRITVASGSQVKLDYLGGDQPVLAVKLQEMFGEPQTPTVADGKVPVLIHLLSPAGRPLQVTADLASFWQNAYQDVKKQMRGRYPKHPWPDDPMTALATKYTKKKSSHY
jgi:ATP-dependent helicase HrpB